MQRQRCFHLPRSLQPSGIGFAAALSASKRAPRPRDTTGTAQKRSEMSLAFEGAQHQIHEHLMVPGARIARESQSNEDELAGRDHGNELPLVPDSVKGVSGQRAARVIASVVLVTLRAPRSTCTRTCRKEDKSSAERSVSRSDCRSRFDTKIPEQTIFAGLRQQLVCACSSFNQTSLPA
jgi:hypothetical protein